MLSEARTHANEETTPPTPSQIKRLNVNLPQARFDKLRSLSNRLGMTMTTLVRLGIGTVENLLPELEKGHRIVVVDQEGRPVREIIIPY